MVDTEWGKIIPAIIKLFKCAIKRFPTCQWIQVTYTETLTLTLIITLTLTLFPNFIIILQTVSGQCFPTITVDKLVDILFQNEQSLMVYSSISAKKEYKGLKVSF